MSSPKIKGRSELKKNWIQICWTKIFRLDLKFSDCWLRILLECWLTIQWWWWWVAPFDFIVSLSPNLWDLRLGLLAWQFWIKMTVYCRPVWWLEASMVAIYQWIQLARAIFANNLFICDQWCSGSGVHQWATSQYIWHLIHDTTDTNHATGVTTQTWTTLTFPFFDLHIWNVYKTYKLYLLRLR